MTSQFARNPADALQCFADIQASVKRWDASHYDPIFDRLYDDGVRAAEQADLTKKLYLDAEPHDIYWWPAAVIEKVSEAAKAYPVNDTEIEWNVRNRCVSHVFQRPVRLFTEESVTISAITYACTSNNEFFTLPWVWMGSQSWLTRTLFWRPPNSFATLPPPVLAQVQWLYAAARFAEQRIIGSATAVVNRKVRERIIGHVPDVNVVHLRSYEPGTRDESPCDRHIDFDFRFWVRGHPRKLAGHDEPIWINTYLKGPDNKPIKDRETVFAVTR